MQRQVNLLRLFASLTMAGLFLLVTGRGLFGQVDTGTILGTVQDQSGAVIPNAKVTLTNEGTNLSIITYTGDDGRYVFTPIRVGTYTLMAEAHGFQKPTHPHVQVDIQQQVVVDFTLQPGAITQVVEVTAAPPLLQSQQASVGQVVNRTAVNNLPLNGRNYTFLAQLSAGVTQMQQDSRGLGQSGGFSANGTRAAQNNYLLDGIDNNNSSQDFLNGTYYIVRPPVDAIEEFKVQTANYSSELGRSGGAVLNATLRSGTNEFHGTAWEFLRNDRLDAADFFENVGRLRKGKFRQNQFGVAAGGPIRKEKTFVFGDYEGTRIRQATPFFVTVPTLAERNSGYTDFSDLIAGQSGTLPGDLLGRRFPQGTVFDPATTRPVTTGQVDPGTGLVATGNGFVRDAFTGNIIPANRVDPNAVKILNLYPLPTNPGLFTNYSANPPKRIDGNNFDVRMDHNFRDKDQMFGRFSFNRDRRLIPGPFPGLADGGTFNAGIQEVDTRNIAISETHSLSPTTINVFRYSFGRVRTFFDQPFAGQPGISQQFGIQGVPDVPLNGGLPQISITGLNPLGAATFQPDHEWDNSTDLSENLMKVYKSHSFKGGFEFRRLRFATLQPGFPRGNYNFSGIYSSIPGVNLGNTGRAQFVLTPVRTTVPNGVDFNGGPNTLNISNIAITDDRRNYFAGYFQDDWKLSSKLTLNLGVRWEFFGPISEKNGAQANFDLGGRRYLIPGGRKSDPLSQSFLNTLQKDGISLEFNDDPHLVNVERKNFGPRFGFAYQATPKLVVRGGYGLFYGGFENVGFGPNLGRNYPFQFTFNFVNPNPTTPISFANGANAALETALTNIPLKATELRAPGLQLLGIQPNFEPAYTQSTNLTLQYQLSPNTSVQLGYVGTFTHKLVVFHSSNLVNKILTPTTNFRLFLPLPDFSPSNSLQRTEGNSYYHGLQWNVERRFSNGLNFLGNYTFSKCRTDTRDTLNNTIGGFRAPDVPGFGIQGDYGLCDSDIRQVAHFSGGYELPVGGGRRFWGNQRGALNQLVSGWSLNWILTLQDGQPFTIPCSKSTTSGTSCVALLVPGQDRIGGRHDVNQWMSSAAFTDPSVAITNGQTNLAPLGGTATQVVGPGFHRLDFSLFKQFRTSEGTHLEFRAEFFNLSNTPNFSTPQGPTGGTALVTAPGALDFTNKNFGKITSTRDTPNDPREIQFGLKFYW